MSRAMIHNKDVAKNLWGEAVNTTRHIVNRVYFRLGTEKIPYELWKGRKPNVKYFRIIGSTCFILKDRENVGTLKVMKEYFLVTLHQVRLTRFLTKEQEK